MTTKVNTQLIDDIQFLGGIFQEMENGFDEADYTEDLSAFLPVLAEDEQEFFLDEKDSSGAKWAPLAKSTIAAKGHDLILYETGHLEASLVSESGPDHVQNVTHRGLKFGTSDEKAGFHQEGTSRMPARPPVGITEDTLDKLVDAVADKAVDTLRG